MHFNSEYVSRLFLTLAFMYLNIFVHIHKPSGIHAHASILCKFLIMLACKGLNCWSISFGLLPYALRMIFWRYLCILDLKLDPCVAKIRIIMHLFVFIVCVCACVPVCAVHGWMLVCVVV